MNTRNSAVEFDDADALACLRNRYDLRPGVIHLDGDGVGALGSGAPAGLRRFIEHRWDADSPRPRMEHDWRAEAAQATARLAPRIGATDDEITIADSVSMNLFRALLGAAHLRPDRSVLVMGRECFPTDRCLARSAAEFTGTELVLLDRMEQLPEVLDERTAVVALSHVDMVTGGVRDLPAVTASIHRSGALALWELSNSAGAVELRLDEWGADLAVGCGYKYLGGGPGAPSYGYVALRHHPELDRRLPRRGSDRTLGGMNPLTSGFAGAPPTLSISGFREGLAVLDEVSTPELQAKTSALVELFVGRLTEHGRADDLEVLAPAPDTSRGALVTVRHRHAQYVVQSLFARGVFADYVEPDLVRFGLSPAWLRFVDVWEAAEVLHEVLDELRTAGRRPGATPGP